MKDDSLYLADMLQRARRIEAFTRGGRDEFFASELIQDAVIRNFEVIGEAAARVSHELRYQYPDVAWRKVIGFRNVLIHGYTRLSLEEVWEVVETALPHLKTQLESILRARGIAPEQIPS
ncbi:MAG: DUF86 domain-containing protein [Gemmatimonadetes bacterium]|nr:DUF86 domain-containing protein [Gemmatimonadota bacterium]